MPLQSASGMIRNFQVSWSLFEKGGLQGRSPSKRLFLAGLGHEGGRDRPEEEFTGGLAAPTFQTAA